MLELESEADLSSSNIGTLSLPFQGEEYEEGTLCTVIGWGSLEEGGYLSMILQKVSLNPDIVERDIRRSRWRYQLPAMIDVGRRMDRMQL